MSVSFRTSRPTLGDLRGGVVSAALAIPLAMAYGMFAFVALGDDYFSTGVLAGLWSAIVTGSPVRDYARPCQRGLRQPDGPAIRLATFAAGTTFGELAILDQQARSATVVADTPLACFVLSADSFDAMKTQAPAIAIRLLMNL